MSRTAQQRSAAGSEAAGAGPPSNDRPTAASDSSGTGPGRVGAPDFQVEEIAPAHLGEGPGAIRRFLTAYRKPILTLVSAFALVIVVFAVLPQVAGFGSTLHRLRYGNKTWLLVGMVFESISLFGYLALFRTVFSCGGVRIGWRASYQITLAGVIATKVLAAAGAGGLALTAWALRAAGLEPRVIARRLTSFEILLYTVFMTALIIFGLGLYTGALPGRSPLSLTVLPAAFGLIVIALALATMLFPRDIEHRMGELSPNWGFGQRVLARLATVPRTLSEGTATALEIVRRPQLGLLGAVGYWAFDIATLWASFRAFGASPEIAVVVMAYFMGQLGNVLPLPGGVGGVEGGLIGACLAFGINGSTAVLAVLAYRAISFWLPTVPGAVAYFQLRRTVARWRNDDAETGSQTAPYGQPADAV